MSYDISIGDAHFNVTYNLAPMFYRAHDDGIRATYGMTGAAAVPVLRAMREYFEDHETELTELEPSNGWGTYVGALEFLGEAIRASIARPSEAWKGD
jgi:hypothetical protein